MTIIPEYIDGLPNICGSEEQIAETTSRLERIFLPESGIDFADIKSAYTVALHMHQPLIPVGDDDLRSAEIISNLQHMMEHPDIGDNHNAKIFHWCYKRMGEFIPELVYQSKQPRIMLDYSGTLLHGMRQMGLDDVFDALRTITCDSQYRQCVEWLGSAWGHPVAPSTPVQDYRLHVMAWRHFFAALFGVEALSRVRGFSPAEMALPNHPDVFYEFVKTLKDCGYRWLIVQEHTVEQVDSGRPLEYPHWPHRLVARNSQGETLTITAVIKTQGSDTKLIGQMQPYYEAHGLGRVVLTGRSIPSLVSQIADGENGGVMMNEFPSKYLNVMSESSGTQTPPVNVTEYLEYLDTLGVGKQDFPAIQPIMQQCIWDQFEDGAGPKAMEKCIKQLKEQDNRFHIEGGSWTSNISWVRGYKDVLRPMEIVSSLFNEKVLNKNIPTSDMRYRKALYYLLITQTSCYCYWGEGEWTSRGRELCRRAMEILKHDF
jgi:hypothetical protein